jgi:hypothetical protein
MVEGRKKATSAFSVPDLLATIAFTAILTIFLSSWLAILNQKTDSIRCLTNQRQMMRAFTLYAESHDGLLPPNEDDSGAPRSHAWFWGHALQIPWATNSLLAGDAQANLFAAYASDDRIWKCPADPATVISGGRRYRTVRSVSMNSAVGTFCGTFPAGHSGAPILPTHGPWLDGSHGHVRGQRFRTFGRLDQFVKPAETFVFLDEHPASINDGVFGHPGFNPARPSDSIRRWVDFPANYHGEAAGVSFADEHAEVRKWRGLRYPKNPTFLPPYVPPHGLDWEWLALRTTQPLR